MKSQIRKTFRFATLNFLFIIVYVNLFQVIFGPENSIAGVVFSIIMPASMVRDLTGKPIRHLLIQMFVMIWIALAAYAVGTFPFALSFIINFLTLLIILYAFTYEYSTHMYFPYILSYLFLLFLAPINAGQLPKRLLAMAVGSVSVIAYQWFMGRKRARETTMDVLSQMIDSACSFIQCRLDKDGRRSEIPDMHHQLCRLSQTVYERRKKVLCISDAGFSMISAGRGLEQLLTLISELPLTLTDKERSLLSSVDSQLKGFRSFIRHEAETLPLIPDLPFSEAFPEKTALTINSTLIYIRDRLIHMSDPQRKRHYRKTALSLKVRLQAALDLSPVRAFYAIRIALLLSCATLLVQVMNLPHGKWFLFTLASVSLPYADDVPLKIRKRILATLAGGLASVLIYSFIPFTAGRVAAMMLSGYISFYLTDYTGTFACSTIGALGGAVLSGAFGFSAVGSVFLIRLGYILAGAAAAYAANCLLFPYSRAKATKQLWEKYKKTAYLLDQVCRMPETDTQLYYSLVIQAYLLEEKLKQNASAEKWDELPELLLSFQSCFKYLI